MQKRIFSFLLTICFTFMLLAGLAAAFPLQTFAKDADALPTAIRFTRPEELPLGYVAAQTDLSCSIAVDTADGTPYTGRFTLTIASTNALTGEPLVQDFRGHYPKDKTIVLTAAADSIVEYYELSIKNGPSARFDAEIADAMFAPTRFWMEVHFELWFAKEGVVARGVPHDYDFVPFYIFDLLRERAGVALQLLYRSERYTLTADNVQPLGLGLSYPFLTLYEMGYSVTV